MKCKLFSELHLYYRAFVENDAQIKNFDENS